MDVKILAPVSHAHEDPVPGTVYLRPEEGDKTAFGQALFPVPTLDPNDPVRWPLWRKYIYLFCVIFFTLLGNSSCLTPSVFFVPWSIEFNVPVTQVTDVQNYAILTYGLVNLLWVPLALKFGRRPTWLAALTIWWVFMALCSTATSYNALLTYSIVASLGSGICETVAVMAIDDIFFLHERGAILTYYTAALCVAAISPLPAGYMLALPHSWRSAYYLYTACGVFVWIVGILFLSESHFDREKAHQLYGEAAEFISGVEEKDQVVSAERIPTNLPKYLTFTQRLKPWGTPNHDISIFTPLWRQFTFLVYPAVLWAVIFYGMAIGLGALYIGFSFSIVITTPPWNWSQEQTGLNNIGGLLGVLLAIPVGPISDRFAAWRTRKNNGVREPEMRLWCFLPAIVCSPVGLAVFSCTAYYKLHWIGFFAGNAIFQFANFVGFSMLIAYMVDCYNHNTPELIAVFIAAKSLLSFGVGYKVLTWILADGFLTLGMIFVGIMFGICSFGVFFIIFGKRIRRWTGKWKISHVHKL